MKRNEFLRFVVVQKEVNEIAKKIFDSRGIKGEFIGICFHSSKIWAQYRDFYLYEEDITEDFKKELLPDDVIF